MNTKVVLSPQDVDIHPSIPTKEAVKSRLVLILAMAGDGSKQMGFVTSYACIENFTT
jgi:hypothetical protein